MECTNSYTKKVYRILYTDKDIEEYSGNNSIGTFEFLTEKNARRYIKEQKLTKTSKIVEVISNTTERLRTL